MLEAFQELNRHASQAPDVLEAAYALGIVDDPEWVLDSQAVNLAFRAAARAVRGLAIGGEAVEPAREMRDRLLELAAVFDYIAVQYPEAVEDAADAAATHLVVARDAAVARLKAVVSELKKTDPIIDSIGPQMMELCG